MQSANATTYTAQIYIGGDLQTAREFCREFTFEVGECVTVEPVEFIFTGGAETGVRIGFINYPRFPRTPGEIFTRASQLAEILLHAMCQHSYSIVTSDTTIWFSRRENGE
jgi:hypothetical protein